MSDDVSFILQQISKGVYTVAPRPRGRSIIWTILYDITTDDNTILSGYLYCRSCSQLVKHASTQASNLIRHVCCRKLKETHLKRVETQDRRAAIDACLAWITEDRQPFSAIYGSGFAKLAQFFINMGSKYGNDVDIEDMLPDTATLARTAKELADNKKKEIKDEIADIVLNGGVSATIHSWRDNYVQKNLLGVTLHYEKNLKFYDFVLGMKSMDFERSTDANIFSKLSDLFGEFGITDMKKIKFVTDKESKVAKASDDKKRLNCSSHLFVKVLEQSFNETGEVPELIEGCRKIVKHFKKSNKHHLLQSSENSEGSQTRRNSNFAVCKLVSDNMFRIATILKEKEETRRLLYIKVPTLRGFTELCNDFEMIIEKLESTSSPTLCFVIPAIDKVKKLCLPKDTDPSVISSLKEKIIHNIDKIWSANLSLWHKTAFFLYPPALGIQPTNLQDVKNFCLSLIDGLNETNPTPSQSTPITSISPSTPHSDSDSNASMDSNAALQADLEFFFGDLLQESPSSPIDEIDRYCKEKVQITNDFDVLKWWQSNEHLYPHLSKVALQVHSIPASCTAAQRAFALAGNVITQKKSGLVPNSVNSILFLHSYFEKF